MPPSAFSIQELPTPLPHTYHFPLPPTPKSCLSKRPDAQKAAKPKPARKGQRSEGPRADWKRNRKKKSANAPRNFFVIFKEATYSTVHGVCVCVCQWFMLESKQVQFKHPTLRILEPYGRVKRRRGSKGPQNDATFEGPMILRADSKWLTTFEGTLGFEGLGLFLSSSTPK